MGPAFLRDRFLQLSFQRGYQSGWRWLESRRGDELHITQIEIWSNGFAHSGVPRPPDTEVPAHLERRPRVRHASDAEGETGEVWRGYVGSDRPI